MNGNTLGIIMTLIFLSGGSYRGITQCESYVRCLPIFLDIMHPEDTYSGIYTQCGNGTGCTA